MDIFNGLNPAQKKAVAHTEGPLLIMAGAGSGKTKVLTCRIANLLAQGVAPYSILAITFTNKAATEMRERVDRMIGDAAKDVWLSTFHSFCARFLRREIEATDIYKRNFVIYDSSDSQTVIKECLKEMNLDDKQYTPASVQNAISNAKNQLMGPKAMERDADNFHQKKIAEIYRLYAAKLRNNNALDFDDLLMISVVLLEENEDIRRKYQGRFRYILVDEYQDTNGAQYQLTKILAARHHNLCVVGDADQSIYGWRGADIRNIMDFEKDYPEATVIKLEQNYRSTKNILAAANAVIEHNVNRKPKELWTENATGEKLTSYQAMDERDEAQFITTTITNAKNQLMGPKAMERDADNFHQKKIAEIYRLYAAKLRNNNALDFDDLLMISVVLLEENEDIRRKYQGRFRYILVDEYQDTNGAQYQLTKILAARHHNLCVVGDADQSIYGWRGADIRNIMDFEKDYPEATVIKLEQNYRSTKNILAAANAVIEHNVNRKPKELWTENATGEKLTSYQAMDERDEAQFITTTITKQRTIFNASYGDIAILYRTNAQSRIIEETFMRSGIPYTMVGGLKFYDRKEIKDILAYLRVIYNPLDTVSLMRIINVPKRGLGATTMAKLTAFAEEQELSLFDVISNPEVLDAIPGITARVKKPLELFTTFIFNFMNTHMNMKLDNLIDKVLKDSGYLAELKADKKTENESRIENLKEFIGVARDFEKSEETPNLETFLSQLSLVSDIDNADIEDDRVTLMTLHSAKGLEFPIVFMIGMEEGLFPHSRTLMNPDEIEEERRTCYVGITRAQRKLYLTNARQRTIYGKTQAFPPSRFLKEIPDEYVERLVPRANAYGFANANHYGAQQRSGFMSFRPSASQMGTGTHFAGKPQSALEAMEALRERQSSARPAAAGVIRPDTSIKWKVGDKARHGKWGVGTVVSVKGSGEEVELKIAFPGQGVKGLMQKYAPITKA
ncbi:UvrD-helicase domain-containing protein [Mitsuokella jalaludinii]|uniref:UvrD-helicase domain-containing protein n=4 Tax=Mitsuokella jalaludinii TaxID=187979 RepID=UPI00307C6947